MKCEEHRDLMLLYVTDGLEPGEHDAIRAHLSAGCPACVGSLAEARATVGNLAFAVEPATPPDTAKEKLFATIRKPNTEAGRLTGDTRTTDENHATDEPDRRAWRIGFGRTAMLCAAAAAVAFTATYLVMTSNIRQYDRELHRLQGGIAELEQETKEVNEFIAQMRDTLARAEKVMKVLGSSALQIVPLRGSESHPDAFGWLLWDRSTNICQAIMRSVAPAEEGGVYSLWLERAEDKPVRAGEFRIDESGIANFSLSLTDEDVEYASAMISFDPADAIDEPSGPILEGRLQN